MPDCPHCGVELRQTRYHIVCFACGYAQPKAFSVEVWTGDGEMLTAMSMGKNTARARALQAEGYSRKCAEAVALRQQGLTFAQIAVKIGTSKRTAVHRCRRAEEMRLAAA